MLAVYEAILERLSGPEEVRVFAVLHPRLTGRKVLLAKSLPADKT
jgi:hypothetical protein